MSSSAEDLRTRAEDLEATIPPVTAGPRTPAERDALDLAAELRARAARLDAASSSEPGR
ncbi:hypothetical protein [Streptomyces sp. NPDC020141]|uniref:hypothetical protein n=1 Tax=Streptomyces sp. NPDC020141 TaxID=3365065 RepID=UPI0037913DD3